MSTSAVTPAKGKSICRKQANCPLRWPWSCRSADGSQATSCNIGLRGIRERWKTGTQEGYQKQKAPRPTHRGEDLLHGTTLIERPRPPSRSSGNGDGACGSSPPARKWLSPAGQGASTRFPSRFGRHMADSFRQRISRSLFYHRSRRCQHKKRRIFCGFLCSFPCGTPQADILTKDYFVAIYRSYTMTEQKLLPIDHCRHLAFCCNRRLFRRLRPAVPRRDTGQFPDHESAGAGH